MTSSLPDGYAISTDPARIDVDRVHAWLSEDAYWALGRPRDKQDKAITGSLNFGVYDAASGEQVGYARVVTDEATFAWLCDVYVDRSVRGKGIGKAMVRSIRDHLQPLGIRRVLLATEDAHGVYEEVGFERLEHPERWMALYFT
ncbi:GNAT family N-acetyltransferase [Streptomyces sp. NPDC051684]|uniref:GNAT family N-acetyltransferase n=1 Tax=Streptomyces sp. NPDC051684 TaxID=3365670 RepID=UPI0037B6362C